MTERTPPQDPKGPPPIPRRPDPRAQPPQQATRDGQSLADDPEAITQAPSLHTLRPGIDQPEDRPRTAGRQAVRLPLRPPASQSRPYDPNTPPVGRASRAGPEPKRHVWLWAIVFSIMTGLILTGAAAAYLAIAPPLDLIRQQVIAQVKAKTGRDLTISGQTAFTVFPRLSLSMHDVTLSAPPTMGGAPLVTMAGLEASVRMWPLLSRQISIDQLVLYQPVFDLRVDQSGKRSWDFAELGAEPTDRLPIQFAQAAQRSTTATDVAPIGLPDAARDFMTNASDPDNPSPQVKAKLARLEELTLGDVRIEGGTVLYADARTGANEQITGLDTRVGLNSLASPLDTTGKLDYRGQSIGFDLKLASPKAVLEERPAKLTIAIKGGPIDSRFDGTITARTTIDVDGDLAAKAPSLRALVLWLGHDLPPADGFGPVGITGKLRVTSAAYTLNEANLSLDGATATGLIAVESGNLRPHVSANLKISELDLNRYTLAAGKAVAAPLPVALKNKATPAANPAAKSIEDLINSATAGQSVPQVVGPQVKGYTKRAGWSTDPIPLGVLSEVDADAKLSIGKLTYRELKAGQSAVTVALKNKVLRVTFDDVALYDGHGRGLISIDANPAAPVTGANLSIDGVSAAALLHDAADFDLLAGTGKLTIAIGAQGVSEADLIATTNGKADFAFANGAIVGYNIPGTIRGLTQGKFSGLDKTPTEKTDFSELTASFAIANGTASNQDLKLASPLMRVSGSGQIQLPAQMLDYTIKPKLVANLQGQGGAANALNGIEIPIHITGPWAKPQFAPDASGILKDPSKAIEAAKEIGKQLKNDGRVKELGSALKGWLNKKSSADPNQAATSQPNSKQLLEKLLKN